MSRRLPIADRVWRLGFFAATTLLFVRGWLDNARRPLAAAVSSGWWVGNDQTHYLRSALAFAANDFTPASHWYLPLYSALAALFVPLRGPDPFAIPDLCCLLISLWVSGELGRVLLPDWRHGRICGLGSFFACAVVPPVALEAWVVPWTSTLAAPLMAGCLLATLLCLREPTAHRAPFFAGATGAAVAGCRPIDAVLLLFCSVVVTVPVILRHRPAELPGWIMRFGAGAVVGLLPGLLLYLSVWGLGESPYVSSSGLIGFDWRLLPIHWIELMIDARPALPDGLGLIGRLPFIGFGLLGLLAAVAAGGRNRIGHVLCLLAIGTSILLYLSYRDLHAPGLWAFFNYHYFKWAFGLFGLYSLFLMRVVVARPRHLGWLLPLALLGTFWREVPVRLPVPAGVVSAPDQFRIAIPALDVDDAVVVAADGPFDAIYFGDHKLNDNGIPLPTLRDYKALPVEGGLMVTPLRHWGAGELTGRVAPGIVLSSDPEPFLVRLTPRFGVPCWFGLHQHGCTNDVLPPPRLSAGREVHFDGSEAPFLGVGWSYPEPSGRWTLGTDAELRFGLAAGPRAFKGGIRVRLHLSALWRPGLGTQAVTVSDGRHRLGEWLLSDGTWRDLMVEVPGNLIPANGIVNLWLRIAHPHRPSEVFPPSRDTRPLGLSVRGFSWTPLESRGGASGLDPVEMTGSRSGLSAQE